MRLIRISKTWFDFKFRFGIKNFYCEKFESVSPCTPPLFEIQGHGGYSKAPSLLFC